MGWFGGKNGEEPRGGAPAGDPGRPTPRPQAIGDETVLVQGPPPEPRSSLAGLSSQPAPFAEPPPAPRPAVPPGLEPASTFTDSVEIEGSIEGSGDVVLHGTVRGSINITGTLLVGQGGVVKADVHAREVVTAGTIEGNIAAAEKVRVQATGIVQGDIDSPSIVIDDGGGVEGFVQMEPPGGADDDDEEFVPPPLQRAAEPAGPPAAARFASRPAPPVPEPASSAASSGQLSAALPTEPARAPGPDPFGLIADEPAAAPAEWSPSPGPAEERGPA